MNGSEPSPSRPDRQSRGRSAPRSRNGCITCKQRRVRCNEEKPICGHCRRLDLECAYRKRPRQSRKGDVQDSGAEQRHLQGSGPMLTTGTAYSTVLENDNTAVTSNGVISKTGVSCAKHIPAPVFRQSTSPYAEFPAFQRTSVQFPNTDPTFQPYRGTRSYSKDSCETFYGWSNAISAGDPSTFSYDRNFDPPNGQDSLGTFTFSDIQSNATNWSQDFNAGLVGVSNSNAGARDTRDHPWQLEVNSWPQAGIQDIPTAELLETRHNINTVDLTPGSDYMRSKRSQYLLACFAKITQPPASILITGVRKWRRLQRYLIQMSHRNRAVASALFATIELFAKDEETTDRTGSIDDVSSVDPSLKLQDTARHEIEITMLKDWAKMPNARDALLAAIFLLAWFEVVRDQVFDQKLFPGELAEQVITSEGSWNRYSKQLLQWFNTLDNKASHLGGQHLLSQKALQVVSEHHTQINGEDSSDDTPSGDEDESEPSPNDENTSPNTTSSCQNNPASTPNFTTNSKAITGLRQMKTILLNTILQPALDWYQSTQKYCRKISAHDRHHRSRFTVKDEYEVVIACKQLELELMHLWKQRPQIIRLSSTQLRDIVCDDVAARLEAIFSLYMASFWVLFVYLHRVVWWHLPHSETTENALEETWINLQRSFGEVVEGEKKVVHPALLWPLFMFGSESKEEYKRDWAVEQLLALGNVNTVVNYDDEGESLAPFKLSLGATRNAKRAAVLLKELIRRQNVSKGRVDDKELSMELFGCHFSII